MAQNPYGHAAIRYSFRSDDGKGYDQYVMNVVGLATHPLINFLKPEDYLYGIVSTQKLTFVGAGTDLTICWRAGDPATPGSEQVPGSMGGGGLNRS